MIRIFILLGFLTFTANSQQTDDVLELIKQEGYRGAVYKVPTEDNGWVLNVHRIFPRRPNPNTIPVFLMHGLFVGSFDYVVMGRQKSLGYLLADHNYDVFMGNARGNRHTTVNPKRANYNTLWNFSFNEIGYYDLSAMIDFVLQLTSSSRLFYVGHSQGTTSLMALLSTRPEYNSKIIQAHFFAPVAFTKHLPNDWIKSTLVPVMDLLERRRTKVFNFTDIFTFASPLTHFFCNYRISPSTTELCKAIIFAVAGPNISGEEIDVEILPELVNHISWMLSYQQVAHYIQSYQSGKFRKFDYKQKNKFIYGSSEPPEYDLSKVTAPIYIYRGGEDLLSSRRDVEHLLELLPNVKHNRVIPNYNHIDFNYGKKSRKLIYNDIVKFFKSENINK